MEAVSCQRSNRAMGLQSAPAELLPGTSERAPELAFVRFLINFLGLERGRARLVMKGGLKGKRRVSRV